MTITITDPTSVGFGAERLARIRPAMQRYVDNLSFGGICTLLARRGQVIHFEQVGYQDRESQTPLPADAIYRIYSMTKPIICTALMTLHEEGRFQLFEPVAKYLPVFAKMRVLTGSAEAGYNEVDAVRPMTIQQLFTHTAGLTYSFLEDTPVSKMYLDAKLMWDGNQTLESVIAEIARFPLAYQPGERWHYAVGIDVLAHLIEVLSGQPLRHFLQERIFGPLGMVDTAFEVAPDKQDRLVTMYGHPDALKHQFSTFVAAWMAGDNGRRDVSDGYPASGAPNFARGGHGLFSTAADYLRFAQMLLNRGQLDGARILGRKTVEFMHSNHLPRRLLPYEMNNIPSLGMGFGLGSRVMMDPPAAAVTSSVGEFGWAGAAKTYYWVDPHEEMVGILMSQFMMAMDLPDKDFQVLAYQALVD
ncbi:MAG: serine hydrolase domain-containing protein [Caldilineaceae bacterium]